jgi:hypothetical protein
METQTPTEQAPQASVQDRIGNIFDRAAYGEKPQAPKQAKPPVPAQEAPPDTSIEETETASAEGPDEVSDDPTEPQAPVEETFEVEVEGTRYVLPKKLEKGFLQEKDYTQKAQTLAEQRRNAELVLDQARVGRMNEQFAAETTQEQDQLRALDWALQQPVDWSSMSTDEAFRRKLQLDQWKDEKARIEKGLGEKRQQFGQKVQAEFARLRQQSIEHITKRIPGWNEQTAKAVRDHALSVGLTEAEVNSIIDPRHVEILWQAQQFNQLKANAKRTVVDAKTVKTTPSNPMPQHVKEKLNYRKSIQRTAPNSPERKQAVEARVASIFSR